jgi:hypothetical protein
MTKLSKAKRAKHVKELEALKAKNTFHYVGYNVIRTGFTERADADRYLELLRLLGWAYPYAFYGAECEASVHSNGPGRGFEVYHG